MKRPILIIVLLAFTCLANAQKASQDSVYSFVDTQPVFPGGSFFAFIGQNIHYPPTAVAKRTQGKVFVKFIIRSNGQLTDASIVRSVSTELDVEALRVVNSSPPWQPGIKDGKPVNVSIVIPIYYKLPPIDTSAQPKPISDADALSQPTQAVSSPSYPDMSTGQIFTAVEQEPTFPGGQNKLDDYVSLYLKQSHNTYEGRVIIQFVVEKDGSLSDLKVLRGINPDADALAITIMKNAKFNPGMQNGHLVRVYYTVAMKFTAQPSE